MLAILKQKLLNIRLNALEYILKAFGLKNYYAYHLSRAAEEITALEKQVEGMSRTINSLDQKSSLDIRSQLDLLNLESMGDILWIRTSDPRYLREATFTQIRDYMRSHGKPNCMIILTSDAVKLESLTENDLLKIGLRKLGEDELQ
jgi:hypothetical protein